MSEKKQKNAPPATEKKPEPSNEIIKPEPAKPKPEQPVPSPFPREKIEKAFSNPMLKGLKKYLDPLLTYFESVEKRLQESDKNFEIIAQFLKDRDEKLAPLVKLSDKISQAQNQPQKKGAIAPEAGGNLMNMIMQLAPQLLGGMQSNPMQEKMNTFMGVVLDKAIQNVTTPSSFERYFEDEMAKSKAKAMAKVVTPE